MPRTLLQIQTSLINGDFNTVFENLKNNELPLDEVQRNTLLLLQGRFTENNQRNDTGVIDNDHFQVEKNQIRSSLLDLINDLEPKQQLQDQNVVTIRLARNEKELLDLIGHKLPPKYSKLEVIWNGDYTMIIKALRSDGAGSQDSVAIKVFKTISLVDEENLLHLKDEFNISKRLSKHDGIIDIFDEDLELPPRYFIMPYINGVSLGRYIKNSWSFTLPECLNIFAKLVQAIKEGHDENLIYRNIRPSNVLIDKWNHPQIQPFQALEMAFSRRSIDRVIELSRYWSPEQINAEELAPSADQYSLALLGYELFAGEPLFKGKTVLEIIQARLDFEKNPKETINKGLKNTFCPPDLIKIFLRMLNNDAGKRYLDLEDVLEAWSKVQPKRPTVADYDQFRTLKSSYNRCRSSEGFYEKFYKLFFERSSSSKAVFERVFQENAAKNSKRTLPQMWKYQQDMLDMAMSRLLQYNEFPEAYKARLDQLSAGHHAMGVAPQEYAVFLDTLKEMIAQSDSHWKDKLPELDKTWQLATAQLLAHMENYSG
jgi:serine/threonine protein kinase